MALRALYWGEETNKDFVILIDGTQIAEERRAGPPSKTFVARDYPIPVDLTRGKAKVRVRIETRGTDAPVYEARMIESERPEEHTSELQSLMRTSYAVIRLKTNKKSTLQYP